MALCCVMMMVYAEILLWYRTADASKLFFFYLLNDGHALQLLSETVAIRKRMIYDGHMITVDKCCPNFLTIVLWLRENPGKPQPGN